MFYAISAMLIWATTPIQVRLINLDFISLIFWTNFFAIIPAIIIFFLKDTKQNLEIFIQNKNILLAVGILATINGLTYILSIKLTTVANAVITHYMTPVIVAVAAPFFLKEQFNIRTLIALILSIIGLLLIVDINNLRFENQDFKGILCGLTSAFAYAAVIIIGRHFKSQIQPFIYIIAQSGTALLALCFVTDYNYFSKDLTTQICVLTFAAFNIFFRRLSIFYSADYCICYYCRYFRLYRTNWFDNHCAFLSKARRTVNFKYYFSRHTYFNSNAISNNKEKLKSISLFVWSASCF